MHEHLREHLMEHNSSLIPPPDPPKRRGISVSQTMALAFILLMTGVPTDPDEEKRPA